MKKSIAKKNIIVYDFDRTIYGGETGINFSTFYLKKYPLKSILFLIKYSKNLLFYLLKIINLTTLKERYFKFLETHSKEELPYFPSVPLPLQCMKLMETLHAVLHNL